MTRRSVRALSAAVLLVASLFCPLSTSGQTKETVLLRIAGDDVSGTTLIPAIAKRFLAQRGASGIDYDASVPPGWTSEISGTLLDGSRIAVLISATSTGDGFRFLQRGWADISLAVQLITPAQVRALSKLGNMNSPSASYVMARGAVEIAVHRDNPLRTISFADLRAIYSGQVTDWSQIGGSPGPIHVLARALGSGGRTAFDEMVMGNAHYTPNLRLFDTFKAMRAALLTDPDAIAYLQLGGTDGLRTLPLRVGSHLDPLPDDYGLTSGDYPLKLWLTLYHAPHPNVHAQAIADFVHEAQSVSSQTDVIFAGFFRVGSQLLIPELDPAAPQPYRDLENTALRVSSTVHFLPGSTKMDDQSSQSLLNLAAYLRFLKVSADHVRFVAFCDDNGSPAKNKAVSRLLGQTVVTALQKLRVRPAAIVAMGASEPLASDATFDGRVLNRRVETWILP